MRLYSGTTTHFIEDTAQNQIAEKLRSAFFQTYRYRPSDGEVASWRNSLRAISSVFERAHLTDHGVLLEYQLPLTSRRLDCMVCGNDAEGVARAVIVELKQWDKCDTSDADDLVTTWVAGAHREVLHPSAQVSQYRRYLEDTHTAFYEMPAPIALRSCAYLHNYVADEGDVLFDSRFATTIGDSPIFTADAVPALTSFLSKQLDGGEGTAVLQRIEESRYRPSKKLMDHVGNVIKGVPEYILLDEQLVVFRKVLAAARAGFHDRRKNVIIVHGGPGTGKSVIAINLMSELLLKGLNAQYATGSRAFTHTLRKIIGTRGQAQFNYFNSFAKLERDEIDVVLCDEAHRIRTTSSNRYTKKADRTGKPQINELFDASRVAVFFIDDKQVVRPEEIGSSDYIREHAERAGARIHEYRLEAQFRCAGSDGFVNWVNNTLGIERTANVLWDSSDSFDFQILPSPASLEQAIRERVSRGFTGRLMAGYCWPWSNPRADGTLEPDVKIGEWQRPWNARSDKGRLAPGIPKESLWAYQPGGIQQVGCVYTAQGFEFDYAGVIFGKDLRYDMSSQGWICDPAESRDSAVKRKKDRFLDLVRNTYRVLLSRGLRGCYVCFLDRDTEAFFRSRMEQTGDARPALPTIPPPSPPTTSRSVPVVAAFPFREIPEAELRPFENSVPVYDLRAAAGGFGALQHLAGQIDGSLDPQEVRWIELPTAFRPSRELFVVQIIGESMNRRIPNGAWCLFRADPGGSRNGKIVLVELQETATDGTRYTAKRYRSEKSHAAEGEWDHERIVLSPESRDPGFEAIVLDPDSAGQYTVVGEFVAVLAD